MIQNSMWPTVALKRLLLDMQPGFARRPNSNEEGKPQLRTNNVSPKGRLDLSEIKYVDADGDEKKKYSLRVGDVLFNNTNSLQWVGKTAYVDREVDALFSNHITRLRPNPQLLNGHFLATYLHLLQQNGFTQYRAKQWVSQAAIDQKMLAAFSIPLPPLPEQRRIIDLLSCADRLRQMRREANSLAQELVNAFHLRIFGKPQNNSHNFPVTSLGNVIRSGPRNGLYKPSSFYGHGTPIIRTNDFYDGVLNDATTFERLEVDRDELDTYRLHEGDILINRVNSIEYVGKCALIESLDEPTVFESNMMRLRVDEDKITSRYIVGFLNTTYAKEQIAQMAKRSGNMASINQQDVKQLELPVPNDELLAHYENTISRTRNLLDGLDEIETSDSDSSSLASLFQSLLTRAFTGELTETWRDEHRNELEAIIVERDTLLGIDLPASEEEETRQPTPSHLRRKHLLEALTQRQRRLLALIDEEYQSDRYVTAKSLMEEHDLAADDWSLRNARETLSVLEQAALIQRVRVGYAPSDTTHYIPTQRALSEQQDEALDLDMLKGVEALS